MCTNLAFVPLVYFCYPETANLTLEEMDLLYTTRGESPIKISKRIRREKAMGLRTLEAGASSSASAEGVAGEKGAARATEHIQTTSEKSG